jgi:carboxylesterase type B
MFAFGGRNDSLFRAAVMESGPPTTGQYRLGDSAVSVDSNAAYQAILNKTECAEAPDRLGCLRALNYSVIYKAFEVPADAPLSTFHPVVDGVEQNPTRQLLSGQFVKIPTIQGHNDDEGSLFASGVFSNSDNDTGDYIASCFLAILTLMFRHMALL